MTGVSERHDKKRRRIVTSDCSIVEEEEVVVVQVSCDKWFKMSSQNNSVADLQAELDSLLDYIGDGLVDLDTSAACNTSIELISDTNDSPATKSNSDDVETSETLVSFDRLSHVQTEAILREHGLLATSDNLDNKDVDSDDAPIPVRVQACLSFLEEHALQTEGKLIAKIQSNQRLIFNL